MEKRLIRKMIEISIKDAFGNTVEIGDTVELFVMMPSTSNCGTGKVYYDPETYSVKIHYSPPDRVNKLEASYLRNVFERSDFLHNWKGCFRLLKRGNNEGINNG